MVWNLLFHLMEGFGACGNQELLVYTCASTFHETTRTSTVPSDTWFCRSSWTGSRTQDLSTCCSTSFDSTTCAMAAKCANPRCLAVVATRIHSIAPSHSKDRFALRLNRSHDTQQRPEGVSSPKGDDVGERRWKRSQRHAYKRAWTDENEEKEGQRNRQESKGWIVRRALRSPRVSTETPRCHLGACKLESHACVK